MHDVYGQTAVELKASNYEVNGESLVRSPVRGSELLSFLVRTVSVGYKIPQQHRASYGYTYMVYQKRVELLNFTVKKNA